MNKSPTNLIPTGSPLDPNQELYFGVMEPNQPFEFAIIKKKYDYQNPPQYVSAEELGTCLCKQYTFFEFNGCAIKIDIEPEDTVNLIPGKYFYQIKIKTNDPDNPSKYKVETVVDKTPFYIME